MEGSTPPQAVDQTRPKRRRLPGVNLRPGSVKQARLESGLSLAQLGRGHVTAPAIYLIETGRTRPSLPTLEHIARRTGKPVEFFLADPANVSDHTAASLLAMHSMVAEGRIDEAIQLGRTLLEAGTSAFRLGDIRFHLAQAYLNSSEPEHAAPLLAEARSHFEAVGDGGMIAACIAAQAVLAKLTHSSDAVGLAEQALEMYKTLSPRPFGLELRLHGVLADAHMERHEWDAAIDAYSRAIEIGAPLLDVRRLAKSFSELGHAYLALGQPENASRYIMRSIGLLDLVRDRALVAAAENNIGLAMMARHDLKAARPHLERALDLAGSSDQDASNRSSVLLSLAQLSIEEGDVDAADRAAREALALAQREEDAATEAEAHVWLGLVGDRRGDNESADREFEHAIHDFERLKLGDRLLHTHGVYAEVLERRGELAKAYGHMKQALKASRPGTAHRDEKENLTTA